MIRREMKAITDAAREMEMEEEAPRKVADARYFFYLPLSLSLSIDGIYDVLSGKIIDAPSQPCTTRYAPQSLKEVCGNKSQAEKLQSWLHDWSVSAFQWFGET